MTTCVRTTLDTRPAKPPGPVARLGTSFLEILQILGESALMLMLTDDSLYREARDAVRTVTRATQGVEDQAPISVLSTLASSLF